MTSSSSSKGHSRDLVGFAGTPPAVNWPGDARLAVSVNVHFEEGAERNPLEGDRIHETAAEGIGTQAFAQGPHRVRFIESIFEYGSRRGIWRLLDILKVHGLPATFFCAAQALERSPQVGPQIIEDGHEIAGHGYRWLPYTAMSPNEERSDIQRALQAIEELTGVRPVGWLSRSPSEMTRPALVEAGLIYDSDSYNDDHPYFVDVDGKSFLTVPYTTDLLDSRYWTLPNVAGYTRADDLFSTFKSAFDQLYEEGMSGPRMLSVGLHCRIGGRPERADNLDRILQYVKEHVDVWVAPRRDIANWWIKQTSTIAPTSTQKSEG